MYTVILFRRSTDEQVGEEHTFGTYAKAWDYALNIVDDDIYASINTPNGDEYLL